MDTLPRTRYASDDAADEWALLAPYLTHMREEASQRLHPLRELFDGLRFILNALNDVVPQPRDWNDQLQRTIDLQREVLTWEQARLKTEGEIQVAPSSEISETELRT